MDIDNLYIGDCLMWLNHLEPGSIDLVYLDPPFFTQKVQRSKTRDNIQEYRFSDTWASIDEYKVFIKQRIEACNKALKETGSIFVHCDSSASHHLRLILDEVFGPDNFQSEIIWIYRRWRNTKRGLLNAHQSIVLAFFLRTPRRAQKPEPTTTFGVSAHTSEAAIGSR